MNIANIILDIGIIHFKTDKEKKTSSYIEHKSFNFENLKELKEFLETKEMRDTFHYDEFLNNKENKKTILINFKPERKYKTKILYNAFIYKCPIGAKLTIKSEQVPNQDGFSIRIKKVGKDLE